MNNLSSLNNILGLSVDMEFVLRLTLFIVIGIVVFAFIMYLLKLIFGYWPSRYDKRFFIKPEKQPTPVKQPKPKAVRKLRRVVRVKKKQPEKPQPVVVTIVKDNGNDPKIGIAEIPQDNDPLIGITEIPETK